MGTRKLKELRQLICKECKQPFVQAAAGPIKKWCEPCQKERNRECNRRYLRSEYEKQRRAYLKLVSRLRPLIEDIVKEVLADLDITIKVKKKQKNAAADLTDLISPVPTIQGARLSKALKEGRLVP